MASRRFEGRRVVVTGAASGIGRGCARLLVEHGAHVALLDVNVAGLAEIAQTVGAWSQVVDFAGAMDMTDIVAAAAGSMGGLDGVVNCAGTHKVASVLDTSLEDWRKVLAINLTAPFLICKAAIPLMTSGASVVNVASGMGILPDAPNVSAYAASKGGLVAFSKALAAELAPQNIRVNVVAPGLTDTPMVNHLLGDRTEQSTRANALARYALKRSAHPDEIAHAILFLLSDEASFVTGSVLAADGGRIFH